MEHQKFDKVLLREVVEHLSQFVLERRLNVLQTALDQRTRYLTVVLEDVFQSQNASAVLRTCECLGIQDVHIIENKNKFSLNPKVVMGAAKWLTLKHYRSKGNNSLDAINALKAEGYRVVATSPHSKDVSINQFDLTKGKAAFIFGTEHTGISDTVKNNADEFVYIPTVGLTESLNLSVTAAITMHFLLSKLNDLDLNIYLNETDRDEVMYHWLKLSVKSSQSIENRFLKSKIKM